jgi:dienelactone hydrolase
VQWLFLPPAVLLLLAAAACGGGGAPAAGERTVTAAGSPARSAERDELLAYDRTDELDVRVEGRERRGRAVVSDLTYASSGRRVAAFLVTPRGKGPFAAVLYLHWFAPGEESANRTEFLDEAVALAREGVVSLLPQGRFPWSRGVTADVAEDRRLVGEQVADLRRGLDLLVATPGIDEARLGFVGHDYGAMYGALLAAADRRAQTYVLLAPDATWANWFVRYLLRGRGSATEYQSAFAPLDPVAALDEAAPASVFLQFAEADTYVPGYIVDRLEAAASEPKRLERYPGGHELADPSTRADRVAWLRDELELR